MPCRRQCLHRALWVSCVLLLLLVSSASATRRRHPYRHPPHEALQAIQITTLDAADSKDDGGGKGLALEGRIIGGDYPSEGEYREHSSYVVALVQEYKKGFFAQFCGGTLIDARFILTAAHCIANLEGTPLYAVIGRQVLTDATQGEIIPIERSFVHPSYDPDSVLSIGDIAVSRLAYPVQAQGVRPVKLITPLLAPTVNNAKMATIFGYGRQQAGVSAPLTDDTIQASGSNRLARVDVPLVDNAWCNAEYELLTNQFEIYPQQLCAGYEEGGRSSCQGDSGGPLVAQVSADDGEFYQIGLVSWAQGCASPHFPTVFTRISSYLDFIVDKSTLVQTSLFQGEGAEDNLVYAGKLGNYVFCGTNRSSTLWVDFENLSPSNFVLTVGAFSSLELTGVFSVDEAPFQLNEKGSRHSMPLLYTTYASALDYATVRLNLVTAVTPSKESFAVITGMGLPPAYFGGEGGKEGGGAEEGWYTSEGAAAWTRKGGKEQGEEVVYVSGNVENSEASCLLKYVRGEGVLSFEWRVSCEEEYDDLAVFVDNVALATLSGEKKKWEAQSFEVKDRGGVGGEGEEHMVIFCFFKDRSLSEGTDGAEVKNFVFTPAVAAAAAAAAAGRDSHNAQAIGWQGGEKREVEKKEEKKITIKPTHLRRRQ